MTTPHPPLDVDALLADPDVHVIVCCGSGGVGKTTTAAALGVRAAEHGRRTAVLTIDPARRLAQSMGLSELDNSPRAVEGIDGAAGGELDAMMLDMKRTFDEVVVAHADPETAEQIMDNPFYEALSTSFSGTQEYMAMEKLNQLRATGTWDLIVVDTPPSRSALDFLDAPERLGSFLDGRMVRVLTAPARTGGRAGMRFIQMGVGVMAGAMRRILGSDLLGDVQTFVAALESMFGGFRQRAEQTYALLQDPATAFVVVSSPDVDALREASYFVERLEEDEMPLAGLVLNRVQRSLVPGVTYDQSRAGAARIADDDASHLTAAALTMHADRLAGIGRERRRLRSFTMAHPHVPVAAVPAFAGDVHDLAALREVGDLLARRDWPVD
jgi:anion-transporting  ArsA/GET3 family ATPase